MTREKIPAIFLGHGSPMNAIASNEFTDQLRIIGKELPKPRAILMISAHWETQGTWITAMDKPKTIHDFYGFPKELYEIEYPAPGSPHLANEIVELIGESVKLDHDNWGLDHGTWTLLKFMFPKANIPVLQLSLDIRKPPQYHFDLGKKLKVLRNQGVLIIGSGNIVHNLKTISWSEDAPVADWAIEYDELIKEKLINREFNYLINDFQSMDIGKMSVPSVEHYFPLLYVIGASDENDILKFDFEGIQNASISMRSFSFR
ncbi:4,5-DOPA dioxygenase extradiol [Halobacteriovorax sp. HFRX-2_2]|uniref:4,5-DOPA-extradiol-dioxygenase n=1 Tax=unclassified Halobacteriovorax TaxID=2639665 RepID=UPI003711D46A